MIGAVYDRDYYCDEQITDILKSLTANLRVSAILERKEIENYLLVPAALDRAIARSEDLRRNRGRDRSALPVNTAALHEEITTPLER